MKDIATQDAFLIGLFGEIEKWWERCRQENPKAPASMFCRRPQLCKNYINFFNDMNNTLANVSLTDEGLRVTIFKEDTDQLHNTSVSIEETCYDFLKEYIVIISDPKFTIKSFIDTFSLAMAWPKWVQKENEVWAA